MTTKKESSEMSNAKHSATELWEPCSRNSSHHLPAKEWDDSADQSSTVLCKEQPAGSATELLQHSTT